MTSRAPLMLALCAGLLVLSACGGEEPVPAAADTASLGDRSVEEQALYLSAFRIGESVRDQDQDSIFQYDIFLQGLRDGFAADSAEALAYLFGYQNGAELNASSRLDTTLSPDLSLYVAGFRDGYTDQPRALSASQDRSVSETMQLRQIERQAATNPQAQALLNEMTRTQPIADSILTATRSRDAIQTTDSGVYYLVTAEGEGDSPVDGDRILLSYEARLPDGTPIDGTPQPMDMVLNDELEQRLPVGVIEVLRTMNAGETREIILPPSMGFGRFGIPGTPVGPNTVLTYVVQLVDILDPVADMEATPAPATPDGQ